MLKWLLRVQEVLDKNVLLDSNLTMGKDELNELQSAQAHYTKVTSKG